MPNSSNTRLTPFIAQSLLWVLFAVAVNFLGFNFLEGDQTISLFSVKIFESTQVFGLRIDLVSVLMFLMITLLGALIGKYSSRYLNGEARQAYFYRYLLITLISVSLLVLSNNLLMFFAMWLLSSLGLHQLLIYSPERKQAVAAAWKKFYISRLGDVAIVVAIYLSYRSFGTFDFNELFTATRDVADHSAMGLQLNIIGVLFALGAMCKSAQFPFHFWLPETMETPAPVSALMHAGLINAGGFIIIRLSPLLQHAEWAHLALAFVGSITGVFGALAMITQNDIKKKLAYSTISQMGLMMVSCGLGAYSLALFHIIAHSFYKAHAFLSTGFLVEESKKVKFNHSKPSSAFLVAATLFGYLLIGAGSFYLHSEYIAYFCYAAILMLGLVQNIDFGEKSFTSLGSKFHLILGFTLVLSFVICLAFESFLHTKLEASSPMSWGASSGDSYRNAACFISYTLFVIGLWLSALLIESQGVFTQRMYLYFWNGGYFTQRTQVIFSKRISSKGVN